MFLLYSGQTGTDLNPTENAFGGDPEKMSNEGHVSFLIGHLRPQAPPQVGTPIYPVPYCPNAFLFGGGEKEGVQHSHVKDEAPY